MSKGPHKRKPHSIGSRENLTAPEVRQLLGYLRTIERDYRVTDDSTMWGRHTRIKQHLNRLYVAATEETRSRV